MSHYLLDSDGDVPGASQGDGWHHQLPAVALRYDDAGRRRLHSQKLALDLPRYIHSLTVLSSYALVGSSPDLCVHHREVNIGDILPPIGK